MDARPMGVLEGAERVLREGRLSLAEVLGQMRVMQGAGDARTWCVLGEVARAAGGSDLARKRFQRALAVDATWEPARSGLRACDAAHGATPRASRDRVLIIRAWRRGLWSDVDHVLSSLLAAEVAGRTPVVHWGAESLFSDDGSRDAWRHFFEPVSAMNVAEVGGDVFPAAWSPVPSAIALDPMRREPEERVGFVEMLTRPEPVCVSDLHMGVVSVLPWAREGHELHGLDPTRAADVIAAYRWLARKYLKPTPEIVARVDALAKELIAPGRTLAVHIRGSDKATENRALEQDIRRLVVMADERLRGNDWRLFLLTDWEPANELLMRSLPGRVFCTAAERTASTTGVHYLGAKSGRVLGEEVLIDALLAARCDEFMGVASSAVSFAVNFLKEWGEKSTLVGECFQVQPNAFVHLAPRR